MEKVKAEIIVNDYIIKKEGIIESNALKVQDKDTIFTFDLKKLILTRKNKDIDIMIDFKKKQLIYKIPETNKEFYNKISCLSLTNKDKEFNIIYQMEENVFKLSIKYETI